MSQTNDPTDEAYQNFRDTNPKYSDEPSRFRNPNQQSQPEPPDPHWMDEDTLSMLEECRSILGNRCGRRGNGLDNLETLGDLAGQAFIRMSQGITPEQGLVLKSHYGGVVMIMSKLQRVMTEDLHRDDYVDLINYVLMTYQMRKRAEQNAATNR